MSEAPAPIGFLRPDAPHPREPQFMAARHMTEAWMRDVFTIPVHADPSAPRPAPADGDWDDEKGFPSESLPPGYGTSVLFLDVDGVLNNHATLRDRRFGPFPIDHECLALLHRVVRRTGCLIVLSSSWREMEMLERKLAGEMVFDVYLGPSGDPTDVRHDDRSTKRLSGDAYQGRGSEIAEWLSRHPEVVSYAIVDDDSDMLPGQAPHFVRTDPSRGLTAADAHRLEAILLPDPQRVAGEPAAGTPPSP